MILPTLSTDAKFSAARRFLFRDAYALESRSQVIGWWEKRRLAYNIAVGVAGLLTLATMAGATVVTRGSFGFPPLVAVIVYGGVANFAYTGGWVAELLLRPVFGHQTGTVGATLFRYGLAFSVGLTLLPAVVTAVGLVGYLVNAAL